MEGSLVAILVGVFALLVVAVVDIIGGWKKRRLKYTLKKVVNYLAPLLYLMILLYSIVFILVVLTIVEDSPVMGSDSWVIGIAPLMWAVTFVFWVIPWWAKRYSTPTINYTAQELDWRKEEIQRTYNKTPKWLKWFTKPQKDSKHII